MNNPASKNFRFQSLNALRFCAFILVFLRHINGAILPGDLPTISFLINGSSFEFFFVLGGFLFTYLLLKEKDRSENFNYLRYYFKRICNTWPLFFVIVISTYLTNHFFWSFNENIGFHIVDGYLPKWRVSVFFLENYKMWLENFANPSDGLAWFPKFSQLIVTWYICIQQHFYILWPLIIVFIPNKHLLKVFTGLITFSFLLKIGIAFYFNNPDVVLAHDLFTYLDIYSIGGLLGYIAYFHYDRLNQIIRKIPKWSMIFYIVFLFFLLKANIIFEQLHHLSNAFWNIFIGVFLTLFIALFISSDAKLKFSNKSVFSRLGKISYSLYLTHLLIIHLLLDFFVKNEFKLDSVFNFSIFLILSLAGSIIIGYTSYFLFELPFYKLRDKYLFSKK